MSRVGLHGQISKINSHLYLSGAQVLKPEKLKSKQIKSIINVTVDQPNAYLTGVEYLKVSESHLFHIHSMWHIPQQLQICVEDSNSSQLAPYFDQVADRIKANRDAGIVTLVHCVAGVSRSATLCIVYLMRFIFHCSFPKISGFSSDIATFHFMTRTHMSNTLGLLYVQILDFGQLKIV